MMPVLTVFIDSLKPESVEYMDFVNSFENKARIRTELPSYSNTCHASMYTGVYPEKHKYFFIWRHSPETSPFRLFAKLKLSSFHNIHLKYLFYAGMCKLKYGIVPYGYMFFARQPMQYWANFSFQMVKFWGKPDMRLGDYPTIFKILNDAGIKYQVIWKPEGSPREIKVKTLPDPFTYIFIGHMDPITHRYGQSSSKAREVLKQIDGILEKTYLTFKKVLKDDFFFLVFSDHGQTEIKERVNLYSFFRLNGEDLNKYLHFIDSCYVRFWFKSAEERENAEKVLSKLEDDNKGFIITHNIMEKYHAKIPESEYGDLVFYLKPPYVFDVVDPKAVSMHGYLPDHPDSDGVLISNKRLKKDVVILQDIAPSILQALGLRVHDHMDGEPIWR
jgi:hypothetical protein